MTSAPRILVTGATGFVGSALLERLLEEKVHVVAALLEGEETISLPAEVDRITVPPLSEMSDYRFALQRVDVVIHLAARVHVMHDLVADPLIEFRKVNLHGTERLARQAASLGVRRFVFISTVKVFGEESDTRYSEHSPFGPADPYGVSKLEAEDALRRIATETRLEVVVVRPPLVYGPGVKANFLQLLDAVWRGVPLPLASVDNRRSLVFLGNLVDALVSCALHQEGGGHEFLVSDGDDVSTPELVRRIAIAFRKPAHLLHFSPLLLSWAGRACGRGPTVERLLGSLQVDSSRISQVLGWTPPFTMEQGLDKTAQWYMRRTKIEGTVAMKRASDLTLSFLLLVCLSVPMLVIALLVMVTSPGSALYWSDRIGRDNTVFRMPKFRSMRIDTPAVATHLLTNPDQFLTPIGKFLRKMSLDELPQLISILRGDMSFVGPRPALYNQDDLIHLRTQKGVHVLTPGLTGWAQINGRDELPIPVKVDFDEYYLKHRSFSLDLRILMITALKVVNREGVAH